MRAVGRISIHSSTVSAARALARELDVLRGLVGHRAAADRLHHRERHVGAGEHLVRHHGAALRGAAEHVRLVVRLIKLADCDILDTPPEEVFDRIAYIAAQVCNCPVAVVNFIDRDRQWFKARVNLVQVPWWCAIGIPTGWPRRGHLCRPGKYALPGNRPRR